MTTSIQQKLTNAYNEFVVAFCERHGKCDATRDEAHERASWCVSLGQSIADTFIKFKLDTDVSEFVVDSIRGLLTKDEAYLVACAVAVALEEVK